MEVLKRIELKDYYTQLYEDNSSLEEYYGKKTKVKTNRPEQDSFQFDDVNEEDIHFYTSPFQRHHWKFKTDLRTEKDYLENYGNPVAMVRLVKVVLVLEKSEEKISLKFFKYINQRGVGLQWFKKSTNLTYATYNFKTNCYYYGSSSDYHKKRKVKGRKFTKNAFSKKSLENFARYIKNEINYFIIPNMPYKDQKSIFVDEHIIEFLRNIPSIKYNGLLSFDEMLYKNYLDLNNIKYSNNWNVFMDMNTLPLKREYKKNGYKLIDTFMYKNNLHGDKIKKILHLCKRINMSYFKEVFEFFGEDFMRSQDYSVLLSILELPVYCSINQKDSIKNKKCKQNAFSVYKEMVLIEDVSYTFTDHVRMYHFLNRFEVVRWKSKTIEEFRKEHFDWSNKQDFYTKGKYNRLYPEEFVEGIKSLDLDGYFPVLLKTSNEYINESSKQSNCVKNYVNRPESLIISLRKDCPDGDERATIEYRIFGSKENKMRLWRTQTLGRFNKKLSNEWDKPIEMLDKSIYMMVNNGKLGLFDVEVEIGGKKIFSGTKFDESENNYLCWTDESIKLINNNFLNF